MNVCYTLSNTFRNVVLRMKRFLSWLLALIFIITAFSSCKKEEKEPELYYPVTEDFETLDPQIISSPSSKTVAYNCYEGLVRLNENGEIVPAGADSWTISSDALTYTFKLRPNAVWYLTNTSKEALSSTDPAKSALPENFDDRVTAKDYVFGLSRTVDPSTASPDGKYYACIKNAAAILKGEAKPQDLGVKALDEYTLQITLDYADPDFLYYLTRLAAMPCNETFFYACKGRYGLEMEYLLCNGAYVVYRWSQGSLIRLEKNVKYTGADPSLCARVWVYYIKDAKTVTERIKKGNYDAAIISAVDAESFKKSKKCTLVSRSGAVWGYWFNAASPKFAITELRQAFAAVTDKSLITAPSYANGRTDRLLTDAVSPYFEYTPTPIAYDEAVAADYFKKAMEMNASVDASVTVTVLTTQELEDQVKKQIQIWQKVFGADIKIKTESRETALSLFKSGNYEIAFLPVSVSAANTSEYFRTYLSGSEHNVTGYANTNYDELVNSVTMNMTTAEKEEIYKRCEQSLISHAVAVPVFTEASYFIMNEDVEGLYSFSDNEIYFRKGITN